MLWGISMEEICKYLCSTEICIEKVRAGLTHTMAELYEIIGRSVSTSIQRIVRATFFSANYYFQDDKIMIYFFDQLDPEEITNFVMSQKAIEIEYRYVYGLVCRIQQQVINQFYKALNSYKKEHCIDICISKSRPLSDKEYKKFSAVYQKAFERRTKNPHKRIRQ